jgi:hypothetical protein
MAGTNMGKSSLAFKPRFREGIKTEIIRKVEAARVAAGDRVIPETVVGEKRRYHDFKINLGGVRPLVKPGDKIETGAILAQTKGFFGVLGKTIKSPASGQVAAIEHRIVTVSERLESELVVSGCWGKVQQVSGDEVRIITAVNEYQAAIGIGGSAEGILHKVAEPGEILTPQLIDQRSRGCIAYGGCLLLPETVEKAKAVGVKAIICGGMNYRDFLAVGRKTALLPVLITEGFGPIDLTFPIPVGFGIVAADQHKLVIPQMLEEKSWRLEETVDQISTREIKKGAEVRILTLDFFGQIGHIESDAVFETTMECGLTFLSLKVKVGEKEIVVAVSNLQAV